LRAIVPATQREREREREKGWGRVMDSVTAVAELNKCTLTATIMDK
jgi:hypothetical protein